MGTEDGKGQGSHGHNGMSAPQINRGGLRAGLSGGRALALLSMTASLLHAATVHSACTSLRSQFGVCS